MTPSSPESSEVTPGEEPGADLLKRVAMEKAGVRKSATEKEVRFIDELSRVAGEDILGDVLPAARRYIKEVERVHFGRNGVLLAGTIPIVMVIRDANLFTWFFLILWILAGAKIIALSQANQEFQIWNIAEALHKLNAVDGK